MVSKVVQIPKKSSRRRNYVHDVTATIFFCGVVISKKNLLKEERRLFANVDYAITVFWLVIRQDFVPRIASAKSLALLVQWTRQPVRTMSATVKADSTQNLVQIVVLLVSMLQAMGVLPVGSVI